MSFADQLALGDSRVLTGLGDPVTYTPGVGAAVDVRGVFDAVHVHVDVSEPGVTSSGPAVWLRLDDLPSDPAADLEASVTVDGVTYTPHARQKDGKGTIRLLLHRV